jgi:hypothetical protein
MLTRRATDFGQLCCELLAREHIKHDDLHGAPRHPRAEEVHDAMHHGRRFAGSSDCEHTGV